MKRDLPVTDLLEEEQKGKVGCYCPTQEIEEEGVANVTCSGERKRKRMNPGTRLLILKDDGRKRGGGANFFGARGVDEKRRVPDIARKEKKTENQKQNRMCELHLEGGGKREQLSRPCKKRGRCQEGTWEFWGGQIKNGGPRSLFQAE